MCKGKVHVLDVHIGAMITLIMLLMSMGVCIYALLDVSIMCVHQLCTWIRCITHVRCGAYIFGCVS